MSIVVAHFPNDLPSQPYAVAAPRNGDVLHVTLQSAYTPCGGDHQFDDLLALLDRIEFTAIPA